MTKCPHLYIYGGSANPGHEDPEQQAPGQEAAVCSPTNTNHSDVIINSLHWKAYQCQSLWLCKFVQMNTSDQAGGYQRGENFLSSTSRY